MAPNTKKAMRMEQHRIMRKAIITILCAVFVLSGVPSAGSAPNKVIRANRQRAARAKVAIAEAKRQMTKVRAQLERMDIAFAITVERYNDIRIHLRETESEISVNLTRLDKAIGDLVAARTLLNDRVVNIYKHGKAGAVEVFLNTNGFDDFLTSVDLLTFIADADKEMVVRIARNKARVQSAQDELLAKRRRQKMLRDDIQSQKEKIRDQIAARRSYLSRLSAGVRSLVAQQRAAEKRIAAEQARLAAASRRSGSGTGWYRGAVGRGGRQDVVRLAMGFLGVPYVWGGESPSGVDCSGLVLLVYREVGISLPHHAADQYNYGRSVSRGSLLPGDLVFFARGGDIYHVAIYIGNGNIIEAPFTGASVWVKSLDAKSNYYGAKRLL